MRKIKGEKVFDYECFTVGVLLMLFIWCSPVLGVTSKSINAKIGEGKVKILSAAICDDTISVQLTPNEESGDFSLELIRAGGGTYVLVQPTNRSGGTYTEHFNPTGLPSGNNGEFTQIKAKWKVNDKDNEDTYDYHFKVLGNYRHSQYNTPDESHSTCGGGNVNVCFSTSACAYSTGTMHSTFQSQVNLNGSGRSLAHGNVQPEGYCISHHPPAANCQGVRVYRQNATIRTSCGNTNLNNSTVAVRRDHPDLGRNNGGCGRRICVYTVGIKTVTDDCPGCTMSQCDNFTTDGRCTGISDHGNYTTIRLWQ